MAMVHLTLSIFVVLESKQFKRVIEVSSSFKKQKPVNLCNYKIEDYFHTNWGGSYENALQLQVWPIFFILHLTYVEL